MMDYGQKIMKKMQKKSINKKTQMIHMLIY